MTGPKWYRADALLAFKNREAQQQQMDLSRLLANPLPVFLEEEPIEQRYDLSTLIYSRNLADRVIGDRFDQLYDPEKYGSVSEFYDKFMSQLGFNYDGETNTVTLSFTYKDPDLAADFCNEYALALEQFMNEAVQKHRASTIIRQRLDGAMEDARVAEEEIARISEKYGVPDLLVAPGEWLSTYADALAQDYISEGETQSYIAALQQLRENSERRNLLSEPQGPPDTTLINDIITTALRFRLAMLNTSIDFSEQSVAADTPSIDAMIAEARGIREYLTGQYNLGMGSEQQYLQLKLDENMIESYLNRERVDTTYARLMDLPALEAEIRPAIRDSGIATRTVSTLDKLLAMTEVGEEYGVHPINARTVEI
ncbi:MAG: hypothetical protein NTY09_10200 [bacterium]|nr:hypothetical protein [bacterium]